MNGIDFLADTNAILYYLTGNKCMEPFVSCKFAFSVISEMELLSFANITEQEEQSIRSFLKKCQLLSLTNEVKNKTILLRRKYNIKLPDAIIAATAIENGLELITADIGFRKISELKLKLITP